MIINQSQVRTNLTSITLDEEPTITKKHFDENYAFANIPVLFKNAFQHLEIKQKWTKEYLINILDGKEKIGDSIYELPKSMTIAHYLNLKSVSFPFKTNKHLLDEFSGDHHTPDAFNCWYANKFPEDKLSWLSAEIEDTYGDMLTNIWTTSAWNFLINGRKEWFIYPAVYSAHIRKNVEDFKSYNDPIRVESILNLDYKPMSCIQEAGDLIFIPGNCFYFTYTQETSLSLSENFINETNYDNVRKYFRNRNNKYDSSIVESIIKTGFEDHIQFINNTNYEY